MEEERGDSESRSEPMATGARLVPEAPGTASHRQLQRQRPRGRVSAAPRPPRPLRRRHAPPRPVRQWARPLASPFWLRAAPAWWRLLLSSCSGGPSGSEVPWRCGGARLPSVPRPAAPPGLYLPSVPGPRHHQAHEAHLKHRCPPRVNHGNLTQPEASAHPRPDANGGL